MFLISQQEKWYHILWEQQTNYRVWIYEFGRAPLQQKWDPQNEKVDWACFMKFVRTTNKCAGFAYHMHSFFFMLLFFISKLR